MLIKNLYANLLDNPPPNVVYLQCHDEKRGRLYMVAGFTDAARYVPTTNF